MKLKVKFKAKVSVKVIAVKKLIKENKSLNKNKDLENRIPVIVIEILIRQVVEINHVNIKK